VEDVVRAWLAASRLAGHRALLKQLAEQGSTLDTRATYRWLSGLARVLERTTRWVLQNVDPETPLTRIVDENLEGLAVLRRGFAGVVAGEEKSLFEERVGEIEELGAGVELSRDLITLRFLDQLLEIVEIARETRSGELETGRMYYAVSETFEVPWLRRITFEAAGDDHWEQRAAQALSEDLFRAHRRLVISAVDAAGSPDGVGDKGSALLGSRSRHLMHFRDVLEELKAEEAPGLAAISVAVRELSAVADRSATA